MMRSRETSQSGFLVKKLRLTGNVSSLCGVLELYFNIGYEHGIISGYFDRQGIPVFAGQLT